MKVIEHLFRNNFAFYAFLGITYILVFSAVNYSIAALSDIQKIKSVKTTVTRDIATLQSGQANLDQELSLVEKRITAQSKTFDDIIRRKVWGKDEAKIFCDKLAELNPGFKCPKIPVGQ